MIKWKILHEKITIHGQPDTGDYPIVTKGIMPGMPFRVDHVIGNVHVQIDRIPVARNTLLKRGIISLASNRMGNSKKVKIPTGYIV